nr:VPS35 endosomal protein-sorting factor-like [Lytechinus pictus]
MATYEWHAKPREYEAEKRKLLLKGDLTVDHPLKPITVHVAEAKLRKSTGRTGTSTTPKQDVAAKKATSLVDPLSSALEGSDPLSQFAAAAAAKPKVDPLSDPLSLALGASKKDATDSAAQGAPKGLDDSFEPWSSKKAGILSKYTTSEKLSITTSFLSPADREKGE